MKSGEEEGFGMVCVEANACGKPVIGGNIGGIIEAIENNKTGFIVDSLDIKDISDKVQFLLENKDKAKEMGYNGLIRAKQNFEWELVSKQIWDLIKNL